MRQIMKGKCKCKSGAATDSGRRKNKAEWKMIRVVVGEEEDKDDSNLFWYL